MKHFLPLFFSLTGCIALDVSVVSRNDSGLGDGIGDTNDTDDTNDTTDTNDGPSENLDTSSEEQYGMALPRGWHLLLDGQHGLMREFPANLTEEFTNILSWDDPWGFSVSLGASNTEVLDYLVSGEELPLFQSDGRLLTLKFKTQSAPPEACESEQSVKPELVLYHVKGSETCAEITINPIQNAKSFCKNLTNDEWSRLESGEFTYSDYLEGGFIVTVFKEGNQMKLWVNQHEVAMGDAFPPEGSECDFSFGNDARELYFGKGMAPKWQ